MTSISKTMTPRGDYGLVPPAAAKETVVTLPDFLTAEECARLAAFGEAEGMAPGRLTGGVMVSGIRSASTLWLDDDTLPWLTDRLIEGLALLNRRWFDFALMGFDEGFQLLRYDGAAESGDFYDWHIDIGRKGLNASRKLSLVLQLSDPADYEGGALEVNADGTPVAQPRARGALTAFPSYMLHRVTPVTEGRRYSLAAWAHGPAFR